MFSFNSKNKKWISIKQFFLLGLKHRNEFFGFFDFHHQRCLFKVIFRENNNKFVTDNYLECSAFLNLC